MSPCAQPCLVLVREWPGGTCGGPAESRGYSRVEDEARAVRLCGDGPDGEDGACNGAATAVLLAKTGGGPPGEWRVFIARRPAGSEGLREARARGREDETDGWSICSELAVAETALAVAAAACGGDDVLAWRAWKTRPGLARRLGSPSASGQGFSRSGFALASSLGFLSFFRVRSLLYHPVPGDRVGAEREQARAQIDRWYPEIRSGQVTFWLWPGLAVPTSQSATHHRFSGRHNDESALRVTFSVRTYRCTDES